MDLSLPRLADGSVSFAFSNAFFEHLYRPARGRTCGGSAGPAPPAALLFRFLF